MLSVLRADTFVTSFIHSFIHSPPAGVQKISALALQHKFLLPGLCTTASLQCAWRWWLVGWKGGQWGMRLLGPGKPG